MRKILIFAGTTEGRALSERLAAANVPHTVCVATEYGALTMPKSSFVRLHQGRMTMEEMRKFIIQNDFSIVVDATHPYAFEVTENIRESVRALDVEYIRLLREHAFVDAGKEKIRYFPDDEACANALKETAGNIFLTTGSKNLPVYCRAKEVRERLFVRVLPNAESISCCKEQGIVGKQVIAMQGPFSQEMNEAVIRQYGIGCLVTKMSGAAGGFPEKIAAAQQTDTWVYVIGMPEREEGLSFGEVCKRLDALCGVSLSEQARLQIVLAGAGTGTKRQMTWETMQAVENADILLGARRLTETCAPAMKGSRLDVRPLYLDTDILPYLRECSRRYAYLPVLRVTVLFSGDSGFYSGCGKLYQALRRAFEEGSLLGSMEVYPGISSVSAMAAACHETWQDAAILSIHGRKEQEWRQELSDTVAHEAKTYVLLSGAADVRRIGELLSKELPGCCRILAGYQLSYSGQQILQLTPEECAAVDAEGLYICLILNEKKKTRRLTHGLPDTDFVRERVPMTKEEVREVVLCKLALQENSVLYDVGSGTGSVALEAAGLCQSLQVYAVEKKDEALRLLQCNRQKFHAWNMHIVAGEAPEALWDLPVPTHAFIGGSGGQLMEILKCLYRKNPQIRVVISAVTLETTAQMAAIREKFDVADEELVQLQVSRSREAGSYRLMRAENPVFLYSFCFEPKEA